jgi:putative membrane protein
MIFLGVLLMTLGIFIHFRFMMAVRVQRDTFIAEGLLPQKEEFPLSLTLVTAILLVLIGVAAGLSVIFRSGPF